MKKNSLPKFDPDEIFMDSENIPGFDTYQFEGRIEKALGKKSFLGAGIFFVFIGVIFFGRVFQLQVVQGETLFVRSERNVLHSDPIFPNRGVIYDRNGAKLAWNDFDARFYFDGPGLSHILGYIGLPSAEDLKKNSKIRSNTLIGREGLERRYNDVLLGEPGLKLTESDSQNTIISEIVQSEPTDGKNIYLSIDSSVQSEFYKIIDNVAKDYDFKGGAGVLLDTESGEVLSLVSWPEYSSQVLSSGGPTELIEGFFKDSFAPFLNRAISGKYAPGSIVKPMVALAVLNEGVISPEKSIYSAGSISLPNPYNPEKPSVFKDWKVHGWVNMREALAVSSDVYFYEVGGGFEDQKGVGIKKIEEYARRFGFNSLTGIDLDGEQYGIIPDSNNKEDWRVGDTYNASIGQGNFQVTPIEMATYIASVANGGKILKPHLVIDNEREYVLKELADIPEEYFKIVREGMRMTVTSSEGTARSLNFLPVQVAAKTGTAEVGSAKKYVNSWIVGFFPYENPRYSFSVVMEKGPYENTIGGTYVISQLLSWMSENTPEYLK